MTERAEGCRPSCDDTLVSIVRNFGHQAAVQAGLAHARGDAVVLMDSDMQDAPEAIPRFLAEWRAGYDVVYAIRTQRKENREYREAVPVCWFSSAHGRGGFGSDSDRRRHLWADRPLAV
jgi:glycosyltransferase involved in cell wall biosynthesis